MTKEAKIMEKAVKALKEFKATRSAGKAADKAQTASNFKLNKQMAIADKTRGPLQDAAFKSRNKARARFFKSNPVGAIKATAKNVGKELKSGVKGKSNWEHSAPSSKGSGFQAFNPKTKKYEGHFLTTAQAATASRRMGISKAAQVLEKLAAQYLGSMAKAFTKSAPATKAAVKSSKATSAQAKLSKELISKGVLPIRKFY